MTVLECGELSKVPLNDWVMTEMLHISPATKFCNFCDEKNICKTREKYVGEISISD